jgi:hypothetical protein
MSANRTSWGIVALLGSATAVLAATAAVLAVQVERAPAGGDARLRVGVQRPGLDSTGVPAGVALRRTGPVTVRNDGAVIQDLDVDGSIEIMADRVTVRRCRVRGGVYWGIRVHEEATGTRLEDVEIAPTVPSRKVDGIRGDGAFAALRLNIHGTGDGMQAGAGTRVEGSWIHDLASGPGDHSDAIQIRGGGGIVLLGNRLEGAGNAAVMAGNELAAIDGLVIERNWLDGGNYTLNLRLGGRGSFTGLRIVGNRFGRASVYGPAAIDVPFEQAGNRWANGKAMRL